MTTPSDPGRPDHGQDSFSSFPQAPPIGEEPMRQSLTPPKEIVAAFWCFMVGAAITALGGVLVLTQRQEILDATRAANAARGLSDDAIQSAVSFVVGAAVVLALLFAALYVLFAFKLRAGRNWARILLTIVAALSLLSLLYGGTGVSVLRVVGDLTAVVGAVLTYLQSSSNYIAATKRQS